MSNSNWWDNGQAREQAWRQMAAIAVSAGLCAPDVPESKEPWTNNELHTAWERWGKTFTEFSDIGLYLKAWQDHIRQLTIEPDRLETCFVQVTITRNYGPLAVTLGLNQEYAIANETEYRAAMRTLSRRVEVLHELWLQENRPGGSETEPMESAAFTILNSEKKGDKVYYKLKQVDGPFSKWGVRVWPEVLADAGIDTANIPLGDFPLGAVWVGKISASGGGKKIVSLARKND